MKYVAKLIYKAHEKPEKIHKFYKQLSSISFDQNTIIALKSLAIIHKYILYGP
jgi:hypothetical protein